MMLPWRALLWGLLAGLTAGCATGMSTKSPTWLARFRQLQVPAGPDVVQMEVVLLERPIGDAYINQEVWEMADEQVVPLERKALLEQNGLRIGQIGGMTPVGLQNLLTSERSCVNPRRHVFHAGSPRLLALGPSASLCQFQIHMDGPPSLLTYAQAVCSLNVVPVLPERGELRLQFTPQIEYGQKKAEAQPADDGSGFVLKTTRPIQSFPALAWEVALAPNQYVIVGARADRLGSFGSEAFIRRDEAIPVQRLLVIRASRALPGVTSELAPLSDDDEQTPSRTTPLALQAACTTVRGTAQ